MMGTARRCLDDGVSSEGGGLGNGGENTDGRLGGGGGAADDGLVAVVVGLGDTHDDVDR